MPRPPKALPSSCLPSLRHPPLRRACHVCRRRGPLWRRGRTRQQDGSRGLSWALLLLHTEPRQQDGSQGLPWALILPPAVPRQQDGSQGLPLGLLLLPSVPPHPGLARQYRERFCSPPAKLCLSQARYRERHCSPPAKLRRQLARHGFERHSSPPARQNLARQSFPPPGPGQTPGNIASRCDGERRGSFAKTPRGSSTGRVRGACLAWASACGGCEGARSGSPTFPCGFFVLGCSCVDTPCASGSCYCSTRPWETPTCFSPPSGAMTPCSHPRNHRMPVPK